jgi:hypothetical protein
LQRSIANSPNVLLIKINATVMSTHGIAEFDEHPVWGRSRDCRCTLTTPIPDRTTPGPNGGMADSLDEVKGSVPRGDGGTFSTADLSEPTTLAHIGYCQIVPPGVTALSPGKFPSVPGLFIFMDGPRALQAARPSDLLLATPCCRDGQQHVSGRDCGVHCEAAESGRTAARPSS